MKHNDKPRTFQYASLVMGGKDITFSSFPTKRPPILTSTKMFIKKGDLINNKFSKNKKNKVKSKNQRPDIFLEGEQLTKTSNAWNQEMDVRYYDSMRDKMRKSTPHSFIKFHPQQRKTPAPRTTNTQFVQQSSLAFVLNYPQKTSNTFTKTNLNSSTSKRTYSTQRHSTGYRQSSKKDIHNKIQQKILHKTDLKINQSAKVVESFKRKQLFYLTQRDLSFIKSQIFIVVQHPSAQVITGSYFKKIVQIASLTKIMTFYTVIKLLNSYSLEPDKQIVQIDDKSADMSGTSADLLSGDKYTVKELLYGLMLPSGNDAALALARWGGNVLGGDAKDFISLMNKNAGQIGMKSSTFGNPHGLPHPQNGSTAEDLSILISKCLEFDVFKEVVKCKKFKCWTENEGVKRQVVWQNTQKLLRRPGFEGVKTGVTVAAGPCLATLYSTNGRTFIVIVLRTNKLSRRFKQTRWLLCMCFRRMNFDNSFQTAIRQLSYEDPQFDSDNSEDEQQFYFDRNDLFQLQRRRRIIINEL